MFKLILDVSSTGKNEETSSKEKDFREWILNTIDNLARNHYSYVKFYPYNTVAVSEKDVIFEADRYSMLPMEYTLAIKAGVKPDNHTLYEVYNGCKTVYVWCHDGVFRVGSAITTG